MQDHTHLLNTIAAARHTLAMAEVAYHAANVDLLRNVQVCRRGATFTLRSADRVVKAKKGWQGYYRVWEGETTLKKEFFGNIVDLRIAVAQGTI